MEKALKDLDTKYLQPLTAAQGAVEDAQQTLSSLQAQKTELEKQIREYYTAVNDKVVIDSIVAKGAPKLD